MSNHRQYDQFTDPQLQLGAGDPMPDALPIPEPQKRAKRPGSEKNKRLKYQNPESWNKIIKDPQRKKRIARAVETTGSSEAEPLPALDIEHLQIEIARLERQRNSLQTEIHTIQNTPEEQPMDSAIAQRKAFLRAQQRTAAEATEDGAASARAAQKHAEKMKVLKTQITNKEALIQSLENTLTPGDSRKALNQAQNKLQQLQAALKKLLTSSIETTGDRNNTKAPAGQKAQTLKPKKGTRESKLAALRQEVQAARAAAQTARKILDNTPDSDVSLRPLRAQNATKLAEKATKLASQLERKEQQEKIRQDKLAAKIITKGKEEPRGSIPEPKPLERLAAQLTKTEAALAQRQTQLLQAEEEMAAQKQGGLTRLAQALTRLAKRPKETAPIEHAATEEIPGFNKKQQQAAQTNAELRDARQAVAAAATAQKQQEALAIKQAELEEILAAQRAEKAKQEAEDARREAERAQAIIAKYANPTKKANTPAPQENTPAHHGAKKPPAKMVANNASFAARFSDAPNTPRSR